MREQDDGHEVTKIHTFKEDVERAQSEAAKHVGEKKEETKPEEVPVYTPSALVDAAKQGGTRDALTYLTATDKRQAPTPEPVATPSPVKEEHEPEPQKEEHLKPEPKPLTQKEEQHAPEVKPVPPKKQQKPIEPPASLSGELETLAKSTKKPSILSDSEAIYETSELDGVETGTIIQDKKRKRFGFTAALATLVGRWFKGVETSFTKETSSEEPVATTAKPAAPEPAQVPETAKTLNAPKDDFVEVVRERIRASKTEVPRSAAAYEQQSAETGEAPGWTHVVEGDAPVKHIETDVKLPVTPLPPLPKLEEQSPENSALSGGPIWHAPKVGGSRIAVSKPVSTPIVTPKEPVRVTITMPQEPKATHEERPQPLPVTPPAPPIETITETPQPAKSLDIAPQEVPPPPPRVEPAPAVAEKPVTAPDAPQYTVDTPALPEKPEQHVVVEVTEPRPITGPRSPSGFRRLEIREGLKAAQRAPTNSLALGIMIVLAAMTLGVFASIKLFTATTGPNSSITIAQPPAVIVVSKQLPIALTNDRTELLNGVKAILEAEQGTVQVYPTALGASGRDEAANADTILGVFDPRIDGSFERAITELAFGGTGAAEPFIVLKTTEFDASFAGLLGWEATMSADLAPLFGTPVTETLDPQARTAGGTRSAYFVDAIIANRSGRVLYDGMGLERLVYVFVDQHTVLITTNRTAVERLVPQVR